MMDITLSNLRYADADNVTIDMAVTGFIEGETIPFTYHADDPAPLSVEVKTLLAAGGYEIAEYTAPPTPPTPVPQSITFRQFYQQLYAQAIISQAELLAAVKSNDMPAALTALVDAIADPDTKLQAQVLIYGGTEILRQHPITLAIVAAFGWDEAQGDDFFIAAYTL